MKKRSWWQWLLLPITATVLWIVRIFIVAQGEKTYKDAANKDEELQGKLKDNQAKQEAANVVLLHNQEALDDVNKRIDAVKKDGQWHDSWED